MKITHQQLGDWAKEDERKLLKNLAIVIAISAIIGVLLTYWMIAAFDPPRHIDADATCAKDGRTMTGKAIIWRNRSGDDLNRYIVRDGNGLRRTIDGRNSAGWQCHYSG